MHIRVVKIFGTKNEKEYFLGTAFFIDKNILLTAKHVITYNGDELYDSLFITCIPDDGTETIEIIKKCDEKDIAILRIEAKFKTIPKALFSDMNTGDEVKIYGYDNNKDGLKELKTYVSGRNGKENIYELTGSISSGYSGSPIIIDSNKICGIAYERNKESNLTLVIPISDVCMENIEKYYVNENKPSWLKSLFIEYQRIIVNTIITTIVGTSVGIAVTSFLKPKPEDENSSSEYVEIQNMDEVNTSSWESGAKLKGVSITKDKKYIVYSEKNEKTLFSSKDKANKFIKSRIDIECQNNCENSQN